MLTVETMDGERVPFAFVNDDDPGRNWGGRDYRGGLRFRPAVVIELWCERADQRSRM